MGEPLLLSPEEAELWRPLDLEHWADHFEPSPIELGDKPFFRDSLPND
jgi:hypothetical protein